MVRQPRLRRPRRPGDLRLGEGVQWLVDDYNTVYTVYVHDTVLYGIYTGYTVSII